MADRKGLEYGQKRLNFTLITQRKSLKQCPEITNYCVEIWPKILSKPCSFVTKVDFPDFPPFYWDHKAFSKRFMDLLLPQKTIFFAEFFICLKLGTRKKSRRKQIGYDLVSRQRQIFNLNLNQIHHIIVLLSFGSYFLPFFGPKQDANISPFLDINGHFNLLDFALDVCNNFWTFSKEFS